MFNQICAVTAPTCYKCKYTNNVCKYKQYGEDNFKLR